MAGLIIAWTIFALLCYFIAEGKNMSGPLWFCMGLAFGIFALIVVILLPSKNS